MIGVTAGRWVVFQSGTTRSGEGLASGAVPTFGVLPQPVAELLASILVLVLAWAVSRLIVAAFGRRIARRFRRPSVTQMVLRGIKTTVFLFAFLFILRIYGLALGDIAISITVFTAVVGVILAPIVGSIISGIFLLADQPYEIGDMVEITDANHRGFVKDITLRYTKILTLDNTFLVVPNGEIRSRDVLNYSAEDPRTRLSIDVAVTYECSVSEARSRIERAARQVDAVIDGGPDIRVGNARYPAAPTCYIETFGDHGVHLRLRYWVKEPYKLLAIRSEIQTNVREQLADAGIDIAYPHQHHVFDETSGTASVSVTGEHDEGDLGDERPGESDPSVED